MYRLKDQANGTPGLARLRNAHQWNRVLTLLRSFPVAVLKKKYFLRPLNASI